MKISALASAALLTLIALAGCDRSKAPDETPTPSPSTAPEPPYQSPQDANPSTSPETTPPAASPDTTPGQTDEGNPAFGEPPPSDTQPEPPKTPSG